MNSSRKRPESNHSFRSAADVLKNVDDGFSEGIDDDDLIAAGESILAIQLYGKLM